MDASFLPPVIVEVAHAPSPDLVAGHVGPAVALASAAPSPDLVAGHVGLACAVPGGNPTAPAAKARAPGAKAVVRSRLAAEKVTNPAGVKRKRIQGPPSCSHSISERDAPAMPFNGVAHPASEVFDEMAGRSLEGRWENMKPMCSRWSACLEQVRNALSSGIVESDYARLPNIDTKKWKLRKENSSN
ncbi:hypothetical protein D1007_41458 [Hordeum vulgare]|nr:hypothetical protein D1007_41458 [Hordeum vulgare]